MKQHELQPAPGSTKTRKRVGRGHGSGLVKTSGRGQKGQKARTGHSKMPAWFEGAPSKTNSIKRQGYKRGKDFNNPNHVDYEVINLWQLADIEAGEITPATLVEAGLLKAQPSRMTTLPQKIQDLFVEGGNDGRSPLVKVLGVGEINKPLKVSAHRFSESARQKIEAAGGSVVELLNKPEKKERGSGKSKKGAAPAPAAE
jgi:large subunit ribosomal protein L15